MKTLVTTALFDIKRADNGDGRSVDEYLEWFSKTLQLKCDILVFTEQRFIDFVLEQRRDSEYKTFIITQKLEEVPFYKNNQKMKDIITSQDYLNKMADTSRIECFLSEYNVIQYSKFGWLKIATNIYPEYDIHFWMDAGCSRFFDSFNMDKEWPNPNNINPDKFTIQGNGNFVKGFESMKIENYIWDNNCMLVGTLFGGNVEVIRKMETIINEEFQYFLDNNCINNEQFALAMAAKNHPDLFDIKIKLRDGHLPLFKMLGV